MSAIYQLYTEIFPPTPEFTEKDLPDLSGKVYIVTGGASGVGFELCKMLYKNHATVYVAGRNDTNGNAAIKAIKEAQPGSNGVLKFLYIDLSDLSTVKPAATEFLKLENRLDVIWHNAGVMFPPYGSVDQHGHELQLGTNVIGPWLFQRFLTQRLIETAKMPGIRKDSVRVLWVSSIMNSTAPYPGGINWGDIDFEHTLNGGVKGALMMNGNIFKYSQSKAANIILAAEAARRLEGTGVLSLALNPGNLKSNLDRTSPGWMRFALHYFFSYPAYLGGLTELFAGLSEKVTGEHNGGYMIPWGRFGEPRADIKEGIEVNGRRLWDYCESECKDYM